MKVLTGYGETTISGHLHPCGIHVHTTPTRSVGVCPEQNLYCSGHENILSLWSTSL